MLFSWKSSQYSVILYVSTWMTMGCPDVWLNITLGVSGCVKHYLRVFPEVIIIWIDELSKANGPFQCGSDILSFEDTIDKRLEEGWIFFLPDCLSWETALLSSRPLVLRPSDSDWNLQCCFCGPLAFKLPAPRAFLVSDLQTTDCWTSQPA